LGFNKRPSSGEWFQKLRYEWAVKLETKLIIEFQIISVSSNLKKLQKENEVRLIRNISKALSGEFYKTNYKHWETYKFKNREECITYYEDGIDSYLQDETEEWQNLFLKRINFQSIPNEIMQSEISLGAAEMTMNFSMQQFDMK
jgi:hypothetical protein